MKKITLQKQFVALLLCFSFFAITNTLWAATPSAIDECAKELLLSYFPEQFVNETLSRYNIPKEKWAGINQALAEKDKDIIKIVEDRAAQMNPNPIRDPQQRATAVKIFRETLYQVFSDALKANGITDEKNFQAMLDDIQRQKAKKFAQCMQKQREEQKNTENHPSSSELPTGLNQPPQDQHSQHYDQEHEAHHHETHQVDDQDDEPHDEHED